MPGITDSDAEIFFRLRDCQIQEIAEVLDISAATVDRELRFSRAWLQRALSDS